MLGYVRLRKTVWRHFNIYDRERMQKFLERQALKGWILDDFAGNFWYFRKELPKKRHYSIIYMPKNIMTEDVFIQRVGEFQEYCRHAGWKCETANDYIRIYYNDQEDPTPIETDPATELESMQQVVRVRRSWKLPILRVIWLIVMMLSMSVKRYGLWAGLFFSHLSFSVAVVVITYIMMSTAERICRFLWLRKARKELSVYGSFSGYRHYSFAETILLVVIAAAYVVSCVMTDNYSILIFLSIFLLEALVFVYILLYVSRQTEYHGAGKAVQWLAGLGLAAVLVSTAAAMAPAMEKIHLQTGAQPPVKAQFVATEEDEVAWETWRREESLFAASYRYDSYISGVKNGETFRYTITTVRLPFLYEPCLREIKDSYCDWNDFKEVYEPEWGAERVYLYAAGEKRRIYVVCYEDTIVEVDVSHEWSGEYIAILAEKLTGIS